MTKLWRNCKKMQENSKSLLSVVAEIADQIGKIVSTSRVILPSVSLVVGMLLSAGFGERDAGLTKLLAKYKQSYYSTSTRPPSIVYWSYSDDKTIRDFVASSKPDSAYKRPMLSRYTSEDGWSLMLANHLEGECFVANKETLPSNSVLLAEIRRANKTIILSCPVFSEGMLLGYVSAGYYKLTGDFIESIIVLKQIANKLGTKL